MMELKTKRDNSLSRSPPFRTTDKEGETEGCRLSSYHARLARLSHDDDDDDRKGRQKVRQMILWLRVSDET